MAMLTKLLFPGGIEIAWDTPEWVPLILPKDSWKKRLVIKGVQSGLTRPFQRSFDGHIRLGATNIFLKSILDQLRPSRYELKPKAIFSNARRDPPRVYVWLESRGVWFFLKIGRSIDRQNFENEFATCEKIPSKCDLIVSRPIDLKADKEWVGLLTTGLSPTQLSSRRNVDANKLIVAPLFLANARTGPFEGIVHCDLNSNNIFELDGAYWVTDWEFAAMKGPDYCDLVGLVATSPANSNMSLDILKVIMERKCGIEISLSQIKEALNFLAYRGNKGAKRILLG